jgi:hypothetical protein
MGWMEEMGKRRMTGDSVRCLVGLLLAVALTGCGEVPDSVPSAAEGEDRMEPAPGQPVYQGAVEVDPESGHLAGRWTVRFLVEPPQDRMVTFLLNRGIELEELSGVAMDSLTVEPMEGIDWFQQVTVYLADGLSHGSVVELRFAYEGEPVMSPGGINRVDSDWVELGADAAWHPLFFPLTQQLRGEVELGLPPGWSVVTSGSVSPGPDGHHLRNSLPQVDIAFSAAPAMDSAATAQFTVHHTGAHADRVEHLLDVGSWAVDYLNERFGTQAPLPEARLVLAPRAGPSYSQRNYLVFAADADLPGERELLRHYCHEFAHFWSTGADPLSPENWLNESFAELVGAHCVRDRLGEVAYDSVVRGWREEAEGQPPVWTPEASGRPSTEVAYRKGPYLLHRLEERMGRGDFHRFLERHLVAEGRATSEMLSLLEEVGGPEVRSWFEMALAREELDEL